jgi:hypothetical protein
MTENSREKEISKRERCSEERRIRNTKFFEK